jgi:hypothetical protein
MLQAAGSQGESVTAGVVLSTSGDAARLAVALFFALAAIGKAWRSQTVADALDALAIGRAAHSLLPPLLILAEIGCAVALVALPPPFGEMPAVVLLVAFSTVLVVLMRRAPNVRCGCLGELGLGGHGASLARNAFLLGLAVVGATAGESDWSLASVATGIQLALLVLLAPEAAALILRLRIAREGRQA